MPDQHPEGYDWLYGKGSDQRSTTAQPAARDDLPPPDLPPPGSRGGRGGGGRSGRGRARVVLRTIWLLLVAWIVFLVAVPLWAYSTISKVDADPGGDRPGDQPGTTYLLVGSDSRKGLTKEEQKQLATGGDGGGRGRTDTILLLHTGDGPSLLLSVPRDSLVPVEGYGTTKINAAYSFGGPPLLVQTVEQATGLQVDHYVEIGFGGLVKVVDSLGGIEICPKKAINDKDSGLKVEKGCQNADGATALAYSRARHPYATQDIQRVQSQREVLGSIAAEVKSPWTFINPVRYFRVNDGAASALQVGEDTGPVALARFAFALSGAMSGDGLSCTVPLADFAVHWDPERASKLFGYVKADRTDQIGDLCTEDGLPKR